MSEAYTGTNLGSLTFNDYDTRTDGNVFNGDILKKLFGAMTGSTNEDKTATLKEATDAVNASSSTVTSRANNSTSYPLTQAQSMNYSQLKGKAGYTIAVEFGGFTWNVVYATIAGGDLIVTLWQSEASGSYQWNTYSSLDTNNNYPSNMYSTSYIRAAALNGGAPSGAVSYATSNTVLNGLVTEAQRKSNQYAAFTLDNSTIGQKSLTSYLVKPNQVAYQEQENYVWAFNGNGASVAYLCPNEAWGSPDTTLKHNGSNAASKTGGWYSGGTNQSNMTPVPLKSNYNDWANDTLWLPSWTETGWYDSAASCCQSLWGIPNGDAILSSSGNTWFRSGSYNVAATSHGLAPSGGQWYGTPTTSACVRPALHLNLTKAMENAGESIKKPADVKVTYNGLDQTVSDIPEADRPAWYDANFYGDTDKVSITYVDSKNATVTPKEAGTYTATVELKSTKYRWSDTTTDSASFTGNRTRTFTFTINPIKLTVPKITNSPQTYDPVNGSHFTVDTNFDASTMTGVGVTTGISWNSASTRFDATNAGTYSVKFQLLDTKNYVWDVGTNGTNADQTATVKVDPKKLTVPTITAPQEYTGSALQFVLADFNAGQYIKVNSASAANGNTVTGAGGATIVDTTDTFEAVKVDKYTVSLSLRDTTNYAWSDGTNTAKNVEFEITQKELLSAPPVSSEVNGTGGAEWNFGDGTVTITITDDRATGENINLLCYYDIAGGTSKSNTLTSTTTGNVTTITMPASIAVGKYTLTVELNGNTGDNANYKITKNNTLDFEITSGKIDPSKYDWTYTKDGAAGGTSANDGSLKVPFELKAGSTVDGVKYELSIQIPTADASAVVVDTSKYVNGYQVRSGDKVNTYKTIVALKSIDTDFQFEVNGNMQSTCEVEFNWEIEKGTFDLSNVKWEYTTDNGKSWTEYDSSNPPQYNDGNYVTVRVKATTLPNGLTLDSMYDGDGERTVGNYTATIAASDLVYNTDNFNA
ncbi:MAG: hypothetical protein K2G44_00210, partial [Clostridia bacterium]|nr:hypothetical protein [Clostridia bacterium]